jgi:hypothetical protein
MQTSRLLAAALSILVTVSTFPASADAVWAIAGKEVLLLHAKAGSLTPEKRVEIIDARVVEMLSKGDGTLSAEDIVLKEKGGVYSIFVRGDILVTVMADDASPHNMTREKLARTWLTAIRNTLPQLAPRVNKHGA